MRRCHAPLRRRRLLLPIVLAFVLLFIWEEIHTGVVYVRVVNIYYSNFTLPIVVSRDSPAIEISLTVLVDKKSDEYRTAQNTVECYCRALKYKYRFVDMNDVNTRVLAACNQTDWMFLRHCLLAHLMEDWSDEWILFIDADMAVINPNNLIEDYLPKSSEIHMVFYQRIFNNEVMAGSYLVRNSNIGREFLLHWASYEWRVPKNSWHGTDNGALHSALYTFDKANVTTDNRLKRCEEFWANAKNYDDLSIYEVCMQRLIGSSTLKSVNILTKGRHSWARDGWLSNSAWSVQDFFLHGWQTRRKNKMGFARWHSPLVDDTAFSIENCSNPKLAAKNWKYKDTFFYSDVAVDQLIQVEIRETEAEANAIIEKYNF